MKKAVYLVLSLLAFFLIRGCINIGVSLAKPRDASPDIIQQIFNQ